MKTAIVLSPFATTPADAGQRKRTHQVTALLRSHGYRITFLFYAFEGSWYYGSDTHALDRMLEEWDEVIYFPADRSVALPPLRGDMHGLDEWWSLDLGSYLKRLFSFRQFDALVVHNVWLSKAFDFCPPTCCKVIETHDLFWLRNAYYESGIIKPEFFVIDREAEIFGLRRSDLVVTIQNSEFDLLRHYLPERAALNIPYAVESIQSGRVWNYGAPDRVSFGVMGSDHGFNVAGLTELLRSVVDRLKVTFAPVEIVVAGKLSGAVRSDLYIKRLGYVEREDDFYSQCDFIFAPNFMGTGFNVKVADAIARGHPMLCAAHAAGGLPLPSNLVAGTPDEMARTMCEIAIHRPDLGGIAKQVILTQTTLERVALEAGRALDNDIMNGRSVVVIDLSALSVWNDVVRILFWVAIAEKAFGHAKVFVMFPDRLWSEIKNTVSDKVVFICRQDERVREMDYGFRIDVIPEGGSRIFGLGVALAGKPIALTVDDTQIVKGTEWHVCGNALRKIQIASRAPLESSAQFIFVDDTPSAALSLIFSSAKFVEVKSLEFDEIIGVLLLDRRRDFTLTWLSSINGNQRSAVIAVAALHGMTCNGLLGSGSLVYALVPGQLDEMRGSMQMRFLAAESLIRAATAL